MTGDEMGDFNVHHVFVYGSLRKHEANHGLLATALPVAMQCRVRGRLYDTGMGYPAMVLEADAWIYGELYQVNEQQLAQLDHLEGYYGEGKDNLYDRVDVSVETDRGLMNAYVYVFSEEQVQGMPEVKHGDWRVSRIIRDGTEWLFLAYGSAMDEQRFLEAGHGDEFQDVVGRGTLQGYSLTFSRQSWDGSRADLMEVGGHIEGKVYRIGPAALTYLFEREGVGFGAYRPALIDMDVCGEHKQDVLIFLNVDKQEETSPPDWYAEEILRGAKGWVSKTYWDGLNAKINGLSANADRD